MMINSKCNWMSCETNGRSEFHVLIDVSPKENQIEWMRRPLISGLFKQCMVTIQIVKRKKETREKINNALKK